MFTEEDQEIAQKQPLLSHYPGQAFPQYPGDNGEDEFLKQQGPSCGGFLHSPHSPLPELKDILPGFFGTAPPQGFDFNIKEHVFPKCICKKQQRKTGAPSVQKLDNSDIKLHLAFQSPEELSWITKISVQVHSAHFNDKSSNVKDVDWRKISNEARVEFDLNKVEDFSVWSLKKTTKKDKKTFYCTIKVLFRNGTESTKNTRGFLLLGTETSKRTAQDDLSTDDHPKRRKSGSFDSVTSNDSGFQSSVNSPARNNQTLQVTHLVAERIETKCLKLDGEFKCKKMNTHGHDIAYHFQLQDGSQTFEEGQVVGILPADELNDDADEVNTETSRRRQRVVKLTFETAKKAIIKGVVTRSQYLEAYKPEDESVQTETICMMGIVPVQVNGSVRVNEFLYASIENPGYAVSEHNLSWGIKKDASFVGVAFSSRKTDDENSTGIVEAGISILECAGQFLVNEKLRNLEEGFDEQIQSVKKTSKRWRLCSMMAAILFVIFLVLLGVFFWQRYTPGSAYRFWMCEKGHSMPLRKAQFFFRPHTPIYAPVETRGFEFTFEDLMKKTRHGDYNRITKVVDNITIGKPRYYLNIERCAYGDDQEYVEHKTGRRIYRGPDVFVVDEKCFHSFFYDENLKHWRRYASTDWKRWKNIYCNPPSPYKNFTHEKPGVF